MKGTKSLLAQKFNAKPFLLDLADSAGAVLLKYFNKVHQVEIKPNAGIVTEADKEAESVVLKKIFKKFPESSIITEETGEYRGDPSLMWILDPLDGTSNYAHGFPWFCVSIGLHMDGQPKAGVIYHPITKEMFYAERGKGAFLNGKRIRVSKYRKLEESLVGTGFYYSKSRSLSEEIEVFREMNEVVLAVRRPGSAALDLASVACGRFDGFWERGLSPWDVAAGFLLVEEAGGKITDYQGKPTSVYARQVVASNSLIHSKMCKIVGKIKTL